jgi:CheY-like chemotaxis protein
LADLAGLRVLVVEDEGPVALLIEDLLEDLGFELAGSVAGLEQAFQILGSSPFDFAVLDVNLGGVKSFDFARALIRKGTPFIFSTGYGNSSLPADLCTQPVLTKPFSSEQLRRAVEQALT